MQAKANKTAAHTEASAQTQNLEQLPGHGIGRILRHQQVAQVPFHEQVNVSEPFLRLKRGCARVNAVRRLSD